MTTTVASDGCPTALAQATALGPPRAPLYRPAGMFQRILDQEKAADEKLTALAKGGIIRRAAEEGEGEEEEDDRAKARAKLAKRPRQVA